MKNKLKINILIISLIILLFSACFLGGKEWEGDITVTGGTKLPNWVGWVQYHDLSDIDGIDVIEVIPTNYKGTTLNHARYIIRVSTYNSFVDLLTVKCNCTNPCYHDDIIIDENEIEILLETFNPEFFETKNLVITELTGGVITMNFRVDNINETGVIGITETEKRTSGGVIGLGISVTIAIEIDNSFVTPPGMTISYKRVVK